VVTWEKNLLTNVDSFVIYRDVNGAWARIGAQPFSSFSQFTDVNSDIRTRSYYYGLLIKNICSASALSTAHQTMHLSVSQGQAATTWNLLWNGYAGLPAGVQQYQVLRGTSPTNLSVIATLFAAPYNTYSDFNAPTGTLFYAVRIAPAVVCAPSKTEGEEYIQSNIVGTAIDNNLNWLGITAYPNPASGTATLQIESSNTDLVSINLTDLAGRTLSTFTALPGQPTTFGAGLAGGTYVLRATTPTGETRVLRWVKAE
jgi:hypothetical protein